MVNLFDEASPAFLGGETVTLGGRALFQMPRAESLTRQAALDWYVSTFNQMLRQIDTRLPVTKQLELLDKGNEALRKAAETALIDRDAVAEFMNRGVRDSLEKLKGANSNLSGDALQAKLLEAMRRPALGCFIAGTLVHTKEGLKPIEQIKVGDWVLSRPEDPEQGTETGYKRVSKTFSFKDKEVVRFWWEPVGAQSFEDTESVYVTPNHPVWFHPSGWVPMGRLHLPGKRRPGTISRGGVEWIGKQLVLADGTAGAMLDVMDLYKTDRPDMAFIEEDDWGVGGLTDFSGAQPVFGEECEYDYENWGDAEAGTREPYTAKVYNFEVEDWHTYFVGKTGLWVHNTNCLDDALSVRGGGGW